MLYKVLSEIMLCKTFVKMRKNLRLLGGGVEVCNCEAIGSYRARWVGIAIDKKGRKSDNFLIFDRC
ncbi:hypothetical protein D931_03335 [Enterococcus faecium 13.SD.W.09]|nr:hypothetical protein D931_03335 [Enterococcus faecium 13.SD.W.09]